MRKRTETRVADTILERTRKIEVAGQTFIVAPPTTATLILVSEQIGELPGLKMDSDNVLTETLLIARDCKPLGDIAAILILGERNLTQTKIVTKKRFWGLVSISYETTIDKQAELAAEILQTLSPKQLNELIVQLLVGMEISDFFALSTSLIEINLTRETREVEKTTRSGR